MEGSNDLVIPTEGYPNSLEALKVSAVLKEGVRVIQKHGRLLLPFALTLILLVSVFSAIYVGSKFPDIFHTSLMLSHSCNKL
jgi:hypothetical protein